MKVHIARTQAVAEFPPASDGQFYEGEAFQAIMGRITAMRSEGLTLRQSGPVLTLSAPINDSGDEKEILASAGRILQKLAG